ncbi:hypothetical protein FB563_8473 [Streptomyces puniciscabiei]|uniref:Uncharacterized protein n=1 Tax=Streptomyces puniciscabiei TaxID=164348 RepID=A0A542SWW2_9ACTN|nr:hypothetical protein [Streptomyces puniciscabiei]TQK79100.1 hypothetical protein FB563_8473 [Streptomyces puniciscabiei]
MSTRPGWPAEKERLSTLPQLEKASRVLARAAKVLFEELELVEAQEADLDVAALWAAVEEVAPRAAVMTAAATEVSLVPEDENSAEVAMRAALANRYATVRPFLALLDESKALDAANASKRVLAGVRGLPALARRKVGVKPLLPREVDDKLVPPAWRKTVYANPDLPQGAVDRDAYVVCVREQLHRALNNRDVFASPSHRRSNPRAHLRDGSDWDAVEEDVLAALSLDMPVEEHLAELVRGLDAGWKQLGHRPPVPAQAPQPEPARPLQLHRRRPGRRRSAPAARPGHAGAGRGRRGRAGLGRFAWTGGPSGRVCR